LPPSRIIGIFGMTTKGLPFVDRENECLGATALTVGDNDLAAHMAGGSVRP
jgi:hypothetical protein